MKPAIFYGVIRTWRGKFSVLDVTTAKRSKVYGRDEHGEPTNTSARDLIAKYPTREAATAAIERVGRKYAELDAEIREARKRLETLERARDDALYAMLKTGSIP